MFQTSQVFWPQMTQVGSQGSKMSLCRKDSPGPRAGQQEAAQQRSLSHPRRSLSIEWETYLLTPGP